MAPDRKRLPVPLAPERSESDLSIPEGLEAGLLGGLIVVLVYAVPDQLAGDWLRTPVRLGTLLLTGSFNVDPSLPSGGAVAVFHLVHFSAWAIVGFVASALVEASVRRPGLRRVPLAVFVAWLVMMLAFDLWLGAETGLEPQLWVASLIAGCVTAAYLRWRHPALRPD
jgi:hypothetical protein